MAEDLSYSDYQPEHFDAVVSTCLHVATVLGALLDDIVVVGGLVPSLLVRDKAGGVERHPGTMDLDLGLDLAVLAEERYAAISDQLRRAGFTVDVNERGRKTFYRWRSPEGTPRVTIDFLIPAGGVRKEQRVAKFEGDFGALATQGLQLAKRDCRKVTISGRTPNGARAKRDIWVCGPGAFVVLKARAIRGREKQKDAYDLYYVLQHYGAGVEEIAAALTPLLDDADAREALEWLAEDFAEIDSLGPLRTALFRYRTPDDELQADVHDLVRSLLALVKGGRLV